MSNAMDNLFSGRINADDVRERLGKDVAMARTRLTRMARRRPILACVVALAAGYMAGRVITRF